MSSIQIDANFAGGNIKIVSIQGNRVQLTQDQRDSSKWWFYWHFSVISETIQSIRFEFVDGDVIGNWGPAVSIDGVNWRWLGQEGEWSRNSFSYSFQNQNEKVYFCFTTPYTSLHFERFYAQYSESAFMQRKVLTVSEQLRPVPLLLLGNRKSTQHVVLTARHHSCESNASYLLEGLLEYFLQSGSSPVLTSFLIHVVPFIDIDGVENGDQGKNRVPHDHNSDYRDPPLYRSTTAMMKYVQQLRLVAAIDFHCPYKWGKRHDSTHFVKNAFPIKEQIEALSMLVERTSGERLDNDVIRHDSTRDLEVGEEWNYPRDTMCSSFFVRKGSRLACTFEFPYFGVERPYTIRNMRNFGKDFARALEVYLMSNIAEADGAGKHVDPG